MRARRLQRKLTTVAVAQVLNMEVVQYAAIESAPGDGYYDKPSARVAALFARHWGINPLTVADCFLHATSGRVPTESSPFIPTESSPFTPEERAQWAGIPHWCEWGLAYLPIEYHELLNHISRMYDAWLTGLKLENEFVTHFVAAWPIHNTADRNRDILSRPAAYSFAGKRVEELTPEQRAQMEAVVNRTHDLPRVFIHHDPSQKLDVPEEVKAELEAAQRGDVPFFPALARAADHIGRFHRRAESEMSIRRREQLKSYRASLERVVVTLCCPKCGNVYNAVSGHECVFTGGTVVGATMKLEPIDVGDWPENDVERMRSRALQGFGIPHELQGGETSNRASLTGEQLSAMMERSRQEQAGLDQRMARTDKRSRIERDADAARVDHTRPPHLDPPRNPPEPHPGK